MLDVLRLTAQRVVETESDLERLERQESGGGGWGTAVMSRIGLPQTRMVIPFSSVDENDDAHDVCGQGRHLTAVGPGYGVDGLVPYADLDGSGDYFLRPDEAGLDLSGAFTVIGWLYHDGAYNQEPILSKWSGTLDWSYLIWLDIYNQVWFSVTGDGFLAITAFNNVHLPASRWNYYVCRFTPSVELAVTVYDFNRHMLVQETTTTYVPASVFNSSADFMLGWVNSGFGNLGSYWFNGRLGLLSLHAADLSDETIAMVFENERSLFDV